MYTQTHVHVEQVLALCQCVCKCPLLTVKTFPTVSCPLTKFPPEMKEKLERHDALEEIGVGFLIDIFW